jgi:hypothetical protein
VIYRRRESQMAGCTSCQSLERLLGTQEMDPAARSSAGQGHLLRERRVPQCSN